MLKRTTYWILLAAFAATCACACLFGCSQEPSEDPAQNAGNDTFDTPVSDTAYLDAADQAVEVEAEATEPEPESEPDPLAGRFSRKLEGATETVDENGVVHGTTPDGINYTVHSRDQAAFAEDRVTLCAVGDQIATDNSMPIADGYAGTWGDGEYDFTPFYQEVAPYLQEFDLRYANQETVMGGPDLGYKGYPSFNSPDACADALHNVGFNLVNFTTNHTWDMGAAAVERSHEVFAQYPEIILGGSYLTQEDRETVHMIERNGITFAFLAYCYGDNNYLSRDQLPNDYYACPFDKDQMAADIERAHAVADVVLVSMHWGWEYTTQVNDQQYEYAKFLADQDVDLVIGTHAHCMQPVEYITGDETGNTVPVVFGLSDFVSGWTLTDTILSGIFTCDFVPQDDGTVTCENLMWHPTIEWSDGGDVYVRQLANMTDDEIANNTRTRDVGDDLSYLDSMVHNTIVEIPTDW